MRVPAHRLLEGKLDSVSLRGQLLDGCFFDACSLVRADLSHSSIRRSTFSDVDLTCASLCASDLTDSDFYGCDLTDCDLRNTTFFRAKSDAATIWPTGFDLKHAGILHLARGADFSGMAIDGFQLESRDLVGCRFDGAIMPNVLLSFADCSLASFRGAYARGLWAADAKFSRAVFDGACMDYADFRGASLDIASWADATFYCAVYDSQTAGPLELIRALVEQEGVLAVPESDLRGRRMDGIYLGRALMQGSVFDGASLINASFVGASMAGSSFVGVDLADADFRRADISGCKFAGSRISRCVIDEGTKGADCLAGAQVGKPRFRRRFPV